MHIPGGQILSTRISALLTLLVFVITGLLAQG
jgi:hypothetical protein